MLTLDAHSRIDVYAGEPRAVRLAMCDALPWLTFAGDCGHGDAYIVYRYGVIGTEYGWLRDTLGDIRLWKSASSAERAARALRGE